MNNWTEEILSTKVDLIHGHQFRDNDFVEDGYPIIKIGQLNQNGELDLSNCSFVSRNDYEIFKEYSIYEGDILMALTGATLGKTIRVTQNYGVIFQNYRVGKFQPNDSTINKEFLYYMLTSENIQREMLLKINTAAQGNIGKADFEKIKIKYPKYPIQQKIGTILSTTDTVIEKTQAAIAKYKAIKQGMLHDLFTRGIDLATNKLRPSYHDAPELYKESKLGWIPKEWEVQIIDEIGEVVTGSTPPTARREYYGDDYLFVSPADIQDNFFISNTEKMLTKSGFNICRQLSKNTICVVCIGSTIGKIAVLEIEGCTNQQINAVIVSDKELSFFYFYSMLYFNEKQFRKETGLQAVPIVNKSRFSNFSLPLIDKIEAIEIAKRLQTIDNKLQSEQNYLQKLQNIKKGLMKDLLSGKKLVKVPEELEIKNKG